MLCHSFDSALCAVYPFLFGGFQENHTEKKSAANVLLRVMCNK